MNEGMKDVHLTDLQGGGAIIFFLPKLFNWSLLNEAWLFKGRIHLLHKVDVDS